MLEQEGVVHRQQGRGSFIRQRAITVGPRRLTSFSQELRERGSLHSSLVISIENVAAPKEVR